MCDGVMPINWLGCATKLCKCEDILLCPRSSELRGQMYSHGSVHPSRLCQATSTGVRLWYANCSQILSRLISKNFLHTELREKGGAYGGGASSSSGLFQFYSYRDPNVQKTLTTFDRSLDWVMSNKFTDQDLQEAKLTVFADLDTPIPPSDKGTLDFTLGITHAMRQA